jgi:hypothetical protein
VFNLCSSLRKTSAIVGSRRVTLATVAVFIKPEGIVAGGMTALVEKVLIISSSFTSSSSLSITSTVTPIIKPLLYPFNS